MVDCLLPQHWPDGMMLYVVKPLSGITRGHVEGKFQLTETCR